MIGIERETLRVVRSGSLATTPHPKELGSPLTNPHITLDFGKAQLEFVTPPKKNITESLAFLEELHIHATHNMQDEYLWPLSMPGPLPEKIELAEFGLSREGQKKHLYRVGLSHRYPIEMQLISGIHLNISFDEAFWQKLYKEKKSTLPMQVFKNEASFSAIRHFLSHGWLLTYFFGASPTTPYSTSTRMSQNGYYSHVQRQLMISHDSLESYLADIKKAVTTQHPDYLKYGANQLSSSHLQIPAEHYARIRPKGDLEKGVEYVEIRSLDLNPYSPVGITKEQIAFSCDFLAYCFSLPTAPLDKNHCDNQNRVALRGRDPNLTLCNGEPLSISRDRLLEEINSKYSPTEPLSSKIEKEGPNFGMIMAKAHKKHFLAKAPSEELQHVAKVSLKEQERMDFKGLELSTELVIKEALKRGIKVEILDRADNIIRLTHGNKVEYIKQATRTSRDSLVCADVMNNKAVTKQILREQGIVVPEGKLYTSKKEALAYLLTKKSIVKPTNANFGDGITPIVQRGDLGAAIDIAFKESETIIIEEFIEGIEHRILVIGDKVVSVLKRDPANVIGDGIKTVDELIFEKNKKKLAIYQIEAPSNSTVPQKGEKIYLRENSNVSTGGDAIIIDLPNELKDIALKAAKSVSASICGVDMIVNENGYAILELNYNPALWMHAFPFEGEPVDVGAIVLDFIMADDKSRPISSSYETPLASHNLG